MRFPLSFHQQFLRKSNYISAFIGEIFVLFLYWFRSIFLRPGCKIILHFPDLTIELTVFFKHFILHVSLIDSSFFTKTVIKTSCFLQWLHHDCDHKCRSSLHFLLCFLSFFLQHNRPLLRNIFLKWSKNLIEHNEKRTFFLQYSTDIYAMDSIISCSPSRKNTKSRSQIVLRQSGNKHCFFRIFFYFWKGKNVEKTILKFRNFIFILCGLEVIARKQVSTMRLRQTGRLSAVQWKIKILIGGPR